MPRSKKDVMKAMPEQLLKDYLRTHHCTSSPHGVWTPEPRNQSFGSPCEVCAMMPEALIQLEKMREELAKYKAAHAGYNEMTTFVLPKKTKEELAKMQEDFKPIRGLAEERRQRGRGRSIDDATPEEWDAASKKVREMTEARGGSVRCQECGGDGISEHPHSGSRSDCYVCDGTGMSSYGRTETRKLCQTLTRLTNKRMLERKKEARKCKEEASKADLEADLEASLGAALEAISERT